MQQITISKHEYCTLMLMYTLCLYSFKFVRSKFTSKRERKKKIAKTAEPKGKCKKEEEEN